MNGAHRDFSQLSVEEKRELRKINEDLSNRLISAHHSLECLKQIGKHNDDPEHAKLLLDDIHQAVTFTDLNAGKGRKKAPATSAKESTVKALLNLDEHAKMVEASTKHRGPKAAPFHIDPTVPLPLSFEARREVIQQQHSQAAESSLSGLFRRNAQLHHGVEQGPVPDIYTPLPTSRRAAVQTAKEQELSKYVSKFTRSKEALLRPPNPPQLHGKKVGQGFVPSCASLATVGSTRAEVSEKQSISHGKIVGDRPFR